MRFHGLLLVLSAISLFAQGPPATAPGAGAAARPAVAAVKSVLGLTDQQVQQLVELRRSEHAMLQPILQQAREKQKTLRDALQGGSTDAAAIGQLTLELRGLRQQIRAANGDYHAKALGLLTDDQKAKVEELRRAAGRRPAINGAMVLGLLLPPAQGARMGRGMGGGMGPGMGGRGGMMRGPGGPPPQQP